MIKLDENLLTDLGLGALPKEEKTAFLRHMYETLEMRVGTRLAEKMSDQQMAEFEQYINGNDEQGAFRWLEGNFPNYKEVVAEEFEKLKGEISPLATQIVAASHEQAGQPQPAALPMQQSPQQPSSQPAPQPQPYHQPDYIPPAPQTAIAPAPQPAIAPAGPTTQTYDQQYQQPQPIATHYNPSQQSTGMPPQRFDTASQPSQPLAPAPPVPVPPQPPVSQSQLDDPFNQPQAFPRPVTQQQAMQQFSPPPAADPYAASPFQQPQQPYQQPQQQSQPSVDPPPYQPQPSFQPPPQYQPQQQPPFPPQLPTQPPQPPDYRPSQQP